MAKSSALDTGESVPMDVRLLIRIGHPLGRTRRSCSSTTSNKRRRAWLHSFSIEVQSGSGESKPNDGANGKKKGIIMGALKCDDACDQCEKAE